MAVSQSFLEYVLDQLSIIKGITTRRMFGGVGIFHYRKIFCLLARDEVYFKVDDTNREKFLDEGSKPLQPFENKPATILTYYSVPAYVLEDADTLVEWAEESMAIQQK